MKDIPLLLSSPTTSKVASIFSRKVHARHREGHLGKANGHDQNARHGKSENKKCIGLSKFVSDFEFIKLTSQVILKGIAW